MENELKLVQTDRKLSGPTGGSGDDMEARVARLEASVDHIQTDVSDIKIDIKDIKRDMGNFRVEIIKWFIGTSIAVVGVLMAFISLAK